MPPEGRGLRVAKLTRTALRSGPRGARRDRDGNVDLPVRSERDTQGIMRRTFVGEAAA